MRWAIKHKSGRTLFVTSDEFIANNRRKMGWIVEGVKMIKLTEQELKELLVNSWFAGHETSRHTPNAYGDAQRYAREAIKELSK